MYHRYKLLELIKMFIFKAEEQKKKWLGNLGSQD
jgi:hypothetical protein